MAATSASISKLIGEEILGHDLTESKVEVRLRSERQKNQVFIIFFGEKWSLGISCLIIFD